MSFNLTMSGHTDDAAQEQKVVEAAKRFAAEVAEIEGLTGFTAGMSAQHSGAYIDLTATEGTTATDAAAAADAEAGQGQPPGTPGDAETV